MRLRVLALLALLLGLAAPAAAQNRFSLQNNTGRTIESLFVSPSRISSWGADVLGQSVLGPGQSFWVVPQTSDCLLDIKVRFQGGAEEERRQVNTCTLSRVVWGAAQAGMGDPSFQFVNRAGTTVNELYVSLSSDTSWGQDRLGRGTLSPGGGFWVSLPSGKVCTVDIKVVYADGRAVERRGVETCSIRELNFR